MNYTKFGTISTRYRKDVNFPNAKSSSSDARSVQLISQLNRAVEPRRHGNHGEHHSEDPFYR